MKPYTKPGICTVFTILSVVSFGFAFFAFSEKDIWLMVAGISAGIANLATGAALDYLARTAHFAEIAAEWPAYQMAEIRKAGALPKWAPVTEPTPGAMEKLGTESDASVEAMRRALGK